MTELSEVIIRLHLKGMSYREIQAEIGCSKGTICYHLGAGQKEKTLNRSRKNRNDKRVYVQRVKQKGRCFDCKEAYPYWVMQFDHVRGTKLFNVSKAAYGLGKTLQDIKDEIEKCDLVCSNCHANRTHMRAIQTGNSVLNVSEYYELSGSSTLVGAGIL